MEKKIIVATTDTVAGREIGAVLGLVKGSTVRTRHIGSDIVSGLKSVVGGEIKGYVKVLADARDEAHGRMLAEAVGLGADAIVCVRYASAQIMNGGAEILAYGTAVKFR